jgi:hypothetical protein
MGVHIHAAPITSTLPRRIDLLARDRFQTVDPQDPPDPRQQPIQPPFRGHAQPQRSSGRAAPGASA